MLKTTKKEAMVRLISGMKAAMCSWRSRAPTAKWSITAPPAQAMPQRMTAERAPCSPSWTMCGTESQTGTTVRAAMIPHSEVFVLPGDSYHVAATHPEACAEAVVAFINRNAAVVT